MTAPVKLVGLVKDLPDPMRRAVQRSINRDNRSGCGSRNDLLVLTAREVWKAAVWDQKAKQAKAKATPKERELRKHLVDLTTAVLVRLGELDAIMRRPSDVDRGRAVAAVVNQVELANDIARYFGLGIDYRTDKKASGPLDAEAGLGHVLMLRFGATEHREQVVLVRDEEHPGLWAIRRSAYDINTPSAWTRDGIWEIEQRPLTKAFVKRGRWTLAEGWAECERVIAECLHHWLPKDGAQPAKTASARRRRD